MSKLKEEGCRVHAWYDSRNLDETTALRSMSGRLVNSVYTGVVLYPDNVKRHLSELPERLVRILQVEELEQFTAVFAGDDAGQDAARSSRPAGRWVVASENSNVLAAAKEQGLTTCLRVTVTDGPSLHAAVESGRANRYLLLTLVDPTNIPMELVIAELQASQTIVIKEIPDPRDVDEALVSLGVMEVGSDGVLYSPTAHETMDVFLRKLAQAQQGTMDIREAEIIGTAPIGMGQRSCIDLVTLFTEREGMLVGSTSQGGLLCCAEVFYLPYMEKRPFRVNAGGVHSYVYNANNRTNYLTELRAGAPATVVGTDGTTRSVPVGRIKTEVRPLRLIEARFEGGEEVNVIMQDDWHVRIFDAEGGPRNITELRRGDRVLGHLGVPGRHVGIAIDEAIHEA